MKKVLIVTTALLLLWGCSKKDDDDDKIFQTESLAVESSKAVAEVPQKSVSEENKLSEEEISEIKARFAEAEDKLNKSIKLKFYRDGSSMKASIEMRCEETDVEELKNCLKNIQKNLESFMRETSITLGDADDAALKEEIAKYNLSTKWFSKISRSIYMVR